MAVWEPSSDDQYLLFAFIGAWGFADGIWQSQINSKPELIIITN
jgi:hypothetical protein